MTAEQHMLWEKVHNLELDDPGSDLTFTERLARENGWPLTYALRAVDEYKRFMFLACVAGHPLTPSDQVDQVWHLHLLYTESYWLDFCDGILGRQVHHGPTRGGHHERDKFTDWYEKTKTTYVEFFGEKPPADIWPESRVRFSKINFRRVSLDDYWILKKPFPL